MSSFFKSPLRESKAVTFAWVSQAWAKGKPKIYRAATICPKAYIYALNRECPRYKNILSNFKIAKTNFKAQIFRQEFSISIAGFPFYKSKTRIRSSSHGIGSPAMPSVIAITKSRESAIREALVEWANSFGRKTSNTMIVINSRNAVNKHSRVQKAAYYLDQQY